MSHGNRGTFSSSNKRKSIFSLRTVFVLCFLPDKREMHEKGVGEKNRQIPGSVCVLIFFFFFADGFVNFGPMVSTFPFNAVNACSTPEPLVSFSKNCRRRVTKNDQCLDLNRRLRVLEVTTLPTVP